MNITTEFKDKLKAIASSSVPVNIPEIGTVHIRRLSAKNVIDIHALASKGDDAAKELRERVIIAAVADAYGEPLFADKDYEFLHNLPNYIVDALFKAASSVNALGEVDSEKKG